MFYWTSIGARLDGDGPVNQAKVTGVTCAAGWATVSAQKFLSPFEIKASYMQRVNDPHGL